MELGPKMYDLLIERLEWCKTSAGSIEDDYSAKFIISKAFDKLMADILPGVPGGMFITRFPYHRSRQPGLENSDFPPEPIGWETMKEMLASCVFMPRHIDDENLFNERQDLR